MASNSLPPDLTSTDLALESRLFARIQRYPRRVIGVGALGLLLLLGTPAVYTRVAGPRAEAANTDRVNVLPVETITVETITGYEVARAYTGEIAALRASELGFEQGGQLVEVYVQEGDRISAGAPLARLDISNLQTQRLQLEAEKARAMAQLAELEAGPRVEDIAAAAAAVRDLEQQLALEEARQTRRTLLYNEGAISREELDETSFSQGALEARLDQAQSNLEELQNGTRQEQIDAQRALVQQLDARIADLDVTIGKSTLKAPYDGIVSTRQVDEGTVLSAGQPVLRLVENAAPEARIGMPAEIANQLQVGSPQTLRLGVETYSAVVDSVLPEVDPETRTQTVIFRLESAAVSRISPGQTVRVELTETVPTDGVWLPTEALTQGVRGLWNCYILVPSDEASSDAYEVQPQVVEILHQEGDRVLVRGTLQPGDRVVASGIHRLVPGQQVQPI